MMILRKLLLDEVSNEMENQDNKWGIQNHDDYYWLGILMEEVGEIAKSLIENKTTSETRREIIQAAAVAINWLECIDRGTLIAEIKPLSEEEVEAIESTYKPVEFSNEQEEKHRQLLSKLLKGYHGKNNR